MLDFTFTEEQIMFRNMVKEFASKELAPTYKNRVKAERIPPELIKKTGDLGLLSFNTEAKYGGSPQDTVTIGVVLEELSRHGAKFLSCRSGKV